MREIIIPSRLSFDTSHELTSMMYDDLGLLSDNEYVFNFKDLTFIEPSGVVSLANCAEFLNLNGKKTYFSGHDHGRACIDYLDDSGFFELYLSKKLRSCAHVRSTTVPLQRVAWDYSHFWLDNKFLTWLSSRLNMPERSLSSIKTCLSEVFNNIRDHSGQNIGCIYMQHFPKKNEIVISISDFGVGIPNTIRRMYPNKNIDAEAIKLATQDTYTSQSVRGNRGAGLDILIRNVVDINRGRIYVASAFGNLLCYPTEGEANRHPRQMQGYYPGTLIEVRLKTDTIVADEDEDEDEFQW